MKLACGVSSLLRDDNIIFSAEDRDQNAANEIAYALYDQFWATNTSANFRLESPENIRVEMICLTATCIEWFMGGWTSGQHLELWNRNYEGEEASDVGLDAIQIKSREILQSKGKVVPPVRLTKAHVFPNRLATIARLKELIMTDRLRVQKEEARRLNEESSGNDND
ncbi:hypothetical protein BDD12DRAFT_898924 [Trichophaea hybrida]|nr:hypothetical protein BDD12DRAFT_898924 [Trichophaea hybrida]